MQEMFLYSSKKETDKKYKFLKIQKCINAKHICHDVIKLINEISGTGSFKYGINLLIFFVFCFAYFSIIHKSNALCDEMSMW